VRIFYVVSGEHVAGGQLVNLAHVTTLRGLGHDARLMIVRPAAEDGQPFVPDFPDDVEPPPWQRGVDGLTAEDVVVVGEMFGPGILAVMNTPARKVIHNQNPHYTFQYFRDAPQIRAWGAERVICASGFTRDRLVEAGWDGPTSVVRPFVDPIFQGDLATPRARWVAFMPRKRRIEARLLRGMLWSRRPDLQPIPWIQLANATRAECAATLKLAAVFLSLSYQEGLGLPPLEAMAGGALVVGFHGEGGREYATPQNGDWFDEGRYVEIVDALAARLDALEAGETFAERRAAGMTTAAEFSRARFEAELRASWDEILGVTS
jgi:hypothetical protein